MNTLPASLFIRSNSQQIKLRLILTYQKIRHYFYNQFKNRKYLKISFVSVQTLELRSILNNKLHALQLMFDPDESQFMIYLIAVIRASIILTIVLLILVRLMFIALLELV